MESNDLEQRVIAFVRKQTRRRNIYLNTDIVDDAGIYGDDVDDFLEKYSKEFGVEFKDFRWYLHTGPEGCNPLWLFFPPWWSKKTHVPIRVIDLIESARSGVWTVRYPENERVEQ